MKVQFPLFQFGWELFFSQIGIVKLCEKVKFENKRTESKISVFIKIQVVIC